jgi:hypothetical protein
MDWLCTWLVDMAIKLIGETNSNGDELPWVNKFVSPDGSDNFASQVSAIIPGQKGYLILAEHFKGFLFYGSSVANHMQEALPIWGVQKSLQFGVFAVAVRGGKLSLAIDEDFECTATLGSNGRLDIKFSTGDTVADPTQSNPFLPKSIQSPPTTSRRGRSKSREEGSETAY